MGGSNWFAWAHFCREGTYWDRTATAARPTRACPWKAAGLCGRVLVKATKALPAAGLGGLTGDRDW